MGFLSKEQAPYTCAAAFFMTLQPILVTNSKNSSGGFDYSIPGSTFLSEALKLCLSGLLLARQCCTETTKLLHEDSLYEFLSFMIPGAIYFVNNNTVFLILQVAMVVSNQLERTDSVFAHSYGSQLRWTLKALPQCSFF